MGYFKVRKKIEELEEELSEKEKELYEFRQRDDHDAGSALKMQRKKKMRWKRKMHSFRKN